MDEEIKVQPEEIVKEQPKAGFLEKLKPHKFKILGGVLGILVFAGAVFGAYKIVQKQAQPAPQPTPEVVATPTPDPTADWQTYTNKTFSYQIDYPVDWRTEEYYGGKGVHFISPGKKDVIYLECSEDETKLPDVHENEAVGPGVVTHYVKHLDLKGMKAVQYIQGAPLEELWMYAPWFYTSFIEPERAIKCTLFKYLHFEKDVKIDFELSIKAEQVFNLVISTFRFLEEESCVGMSLSEAKEIALESECVEEGNLKEEYFCNENTGTWWLDLEVGKPGCSPACVINVSTGEAEINWRCTGLITP